MNICSGATNLARSLFWAVGSGVAGMTMQALSFSAPLLLGGGVKVLYDLLLFGVLPQPETS
jgi:hypothetical protein